MSLFATYPVGPPGRLYSSAMPFAWGDRGELLETMEQANLNAVVLLVADHEALTITGRELRQLYLAHGWDVIQLPAPDHGVPDLADLRTAVDLAEERLQRDQTLWAHCYAGIGRTGLFVCCLAVRYCQLDAATALTFVRGIHPRAVETRSQLALLQAFAATET